MMPRDFSQEDASGRGQEVIIEEKEYATARKEETPVNFKGMRRRIHGAREEVALCGVSKEP